MNKILTLEQVACIQKQWAEVASGCPWDELLASHEALRVALKAAQYDVRALADAARLFVEWYQDGQPEWNEFVAVDKAEAALARPGVQQILEEQHESK